MPPTRILFLDDRWIAAGRGIRREFATARKHSANPLIRPREPWEENRVYAFGSVLPLGEGFRLWYQTCLGSIRGPDGSAVCVADSDDLIAWKRPCLGVEPFGGIEETNIVLKCSGPLPLYAPTVLSGDADPDPSRRYKMLFWDAAEAGGPRGGCAAFSPDGVRWRRHPRLLFGEKNDVLVAATAPGGGFRCYQTILLDDSSQDYPRDNLRGRRRVIGLRESADFVGWSAPRTVLVPDEHDPPDTQFYGMAAWHDTPCDTWIGMLWTYRAESQTCDVQLAWSEDGVGWRRPRTRSPLIPRGKEGEFDSGLVYTASSAVQRRHRIEIVYSGFDGPHDDFSRGAAIGLASLRQDGWCAMVAGDEEAVLETKPLPFGAEGLRLNIDASAGRCTAELADGEGRPLPGFCFEDSVPVCGVDSLNAPLKWQGGAPRISSGNWLLRLRLSQAHLFAIDSADDENVHSSHFQIPPHEIMTR